MKKHLLFMVCLDVFISESCFGQDTMTFLDPNQLKALFVAKQKLEPPEQNVAALIEEEKNEYIVSFSMHNPKTYKQGMRGGGQKVWEFVVSKDNFSVKRERIYFSR